MAEKKICKGECGQEFPATKEYFWAAECNLDGLQGMCKNCQYKANRESRKKKGKHDAYYAAQKRAAKIESTEPIDDFDFGCKRAALSLPQTYISSQDQEIPKNNLTES